MWSLSSPFNLDSDNVPHYKAWDLASLMAAKGVKWYNSEVRGVLIFHRENLD